MNRFGDIDCSFKKLPAVFGYYVQQIVSLEKSLEQIQNQILGLDYFIKVAKRRCHFPSEYGLTRDQSASIYKRRVVDFSPTTNARFTVKKNFSEKNNPRSISVSNHSSTSTDPDERPIRPMRNNSIYNQTLSQKKTFQPKKLPLQRPKPIQSSSRYERDSFQSPLSRNSTGFALGRRPIRIDLIPKTPFGIPIQPNPPRRTIVEEYDDDYPVTYRKPIRKKILSYQKVSGMTTREFENYQMSKPRRVVRVRSPPVERIIYRT